MSKRAATFVQLKGRMLTLTVDPDITTRAMRRLQNGQGVGGARRLGKLIRRLIRRHGSYKRRGNPGKFVTY